MLRHRGTGGMADTLDMALLLHSFLEVVMMDQQLVDVTNSHRDTKMKKKKKTQKTECCGCATQVAWQYTLDDTCVFDYNSNNKNQKYCHEFPS